MQIVKRKCASARNFCRKSSRLFLASKFAIVREELFAEIERAALTTRLRAVAPWTHDLAELAAALGVVRKNEFAFCTACGSILSHSFSSSLAFGSGQDRK